VASSRGLVATVAALVAARGNLDATDARGKTALLKAVMGERAEVVRHLLYANARLDAADLRGRTAESELRLSFPSPCEWQEAVAGLQVNADSDETGLSTLLGPMQRYYQLHHLYATPWSRQPSRGVATESSAADVYPVPLRRHAVALYLAQHRGALGADLVDLLVDAMRQLFRYDGFTPALTPMPDDAPPAIVSKASSRVVERTTSDENLGVSSDGGAEFDASPMIAGMSHAAGEPAEFLNLASLPEEESVL